MKKKLNLLDNQSKQIQQLKSGKGEVNPDYSPRNLVLDKAKVKSQVKRI